MWLLYFPVIMAVLLPATLSAGDGTQPMDLRDYFPKAKDDLSKVTWDHRCNSKAKLEAALSNPSVMMIEADVIGGHLKGEEEGPTIPLMGHPPDTVGDLSLEQFLNMVLSHRDSEKGIKLDFKTLEAFKKSEGVLEQYLAKAEVDFPVWVNADILKGPGDPQREPVEAKYFVKTCMEKFPLATISAGWTVDVSRAQSLNYTSSHVDSMTALLSSNNVVHPVTFPVHAGIASNSLETLKSLIQSSVHGTTLTLWCGEGDWINYDGLRQLISAIGKEKVYVDMPEDMKLQLLNPSPTQSTPKGAGSALSVPLGSLALFLSLLLYTV